MSTKTGVFQSMNTRGPRTLLEKIENLHPERVAQVEDLVDFLCTRDAQYAGVRAAARAAEPAFARTWDNEDDSAYDKL